jgi:AcrR family transcriptional regulator
VELLADRGLSAMSIEEVAARAGVGKTTIYRRWPSKGLLALDAFVTSFREAAAAADTGTLRGDLLAALTAWVRAVTQTPMGPMLTSLIAEAQHDPNCAGRGGTGCSSRCAFSTGSCWTGPSPAARYRRRSTADVVLDLFFGAAEHRLLLGHLPMTDAFIGAVVDVILGGRPR